MTIKRDKEFICDECSREIDQREINYFYWVPMCQECVKSTRVLQMIQKLTMNVCIKEVTDKCQKPCLDCGKTNWRRGNHYVYDMLSPWATAQYCFECAELRDWRAGREGEKLDGVPVPVVHIPPPPSNQNASSHSQGNF